MSFKEIQSDLYAPNQSYSTYLLDRLRGNARWVSQNRGSHITMTLESYSNDMLSGLHERPFVSVARPSIFLRIPWWVAPTLKEVHFRALCRVSNGGWDISSKNRPIWPGGDRVRLSAMFSGDLRTPFDGPSSTEVQPMVPPGGDVPGWGVAEWSYELTDKIFSRETYQTLTLSLKSGTPVPIGHSWGTSDPEPVKPSGIVSEASFDPITRLPYRIKANANGFYDNGPVLSAPWSEVVGMGANEITATMLVSSPSDTTLKYVRGWVDHLERQRGVSGRGMYIWPPSNEAGEDGKHYDDYPINSLAKIYVPYIQFRSIEIWEEHAA